MLIYLLKVIYQQGVIVHLYILTAGNVRRQIHLPYRILLITSIGRYDILDWKYISTAGNTLAAAGNTMAAAGNTLADAGKHTGCDAALNQKGAIL